VPLGVEWKKGAYVPEAERPPEPQGLQLDGANELRLVKG